MATFIEVVPDAFSTTFQQQATDAKKQSRPGGPGARVTNRRFDQIRRPVRGIEIKDDTYAVIQVITADGRNLPLIDAAGNIKSTSDGQGQSAGYSYQYSNFLIQQLQEQRVEKSQVVLTFGEPYIFFFGEQPRMLNIQGVLLNTVDFNWKAEFLENYDKYLRGTRCVQNKARVYLSWDDIIAEGYIMNCSVEEQAQERNWVSFNFQMFLTNYQNISAIGDPNAHLIGKQINLDPSEIDTFGAASAGFESSALAVRQANIAAQASSSSSLLSMLRNGQVLSAFQSGTSRLVSIQGQVTDLIDRAADFVSGRNITVPTGYTGAAAFDQDTQIDLASIDPANIVGNQVTITGNFGGQNFTIKATLGNSSEPSIYGPLSLNQDEFIARGSAQQAPAEFVDLFQAQRGDDEVAAQAVTQTLKVFGIDATPPSQVMQLVSKVGFGVVSYVAGSTLPSVQSQGARQALNVIPQVVAG